MVLRFVTKSEFVVFEILVEELQLFVEDCHLTIDPVYPDRLSVVLFVPVQTDAPPDTDPPFEAEFTVKVAAVEVVLKAEQSPVHVTLQRYW